MKKLIATPLKLKCRLPDTTDFTNLITTVKTTHQKNVMFSHNVISLNHLPKRSKNTADIFLTFRNRVKMFLSQNRIHNI